MHRIEFSFESDNLTVQQSAMKDECCELNEPFTAMPPYGLECTLQTTSAILRPSVKVRNEGYSNTHCDTSGVCKSLEQIQIDSWKENKADPTGRCAFSSDELYLIKNVCSSQSDGLPMVHTELRAVAFCKVLSPQSNLRLRQQIVGDQWHSKVWCL